MELSKNKKPFIIILDLKNCKTLYDIHETIRKTFDFPEWYGKNWSAFNDLLYAPKNIQLYILKDIPLFQKVLLHIVLKSLIFLKKRRNIMKEYRINIIYDLII